MPLDEEKRPEDESAEPELSETGLEPKKGKWVTSRGRRIFIPEGKPFEEAMQEAFSENKKPDLYEAEHLEKNQIQKASYMTASQEPAVKTPYHDTPHYVLTADEIDANQTNARVGDRVKYNHGTKEGILIKIDRSVALILDSQNKYDTVLTKDVNRTDDYTAFGLWKDIPDDFRGWMLRKVKAPVDHYIHKQWEHFPRELKEILRDESAFETTARNNTQSNPTKITDYDGAEETEERKKYADAVNTNNPSRGINGKLTNPQDRKERDGRQVVDNEEQNNTFSAGEEHPEEPYSVNITGGSNNKEDYGNTLADWRFAKPKPFEDVEQDIDSKKKKADLGEGSYTGENKPLNENPHEEEKNKTVGVPTTPKGTNGLRYFTAEEAKKYMDRKKSRDNL